MIDFIVNNYQLILGVLAVLVDSVVFVVVCLKKKSKSPLDYVLEVAPHFVRAAEQYYGKGHGDQKKAFVMDYLKKTYKNLTGVELSAGSILEELDDFVENILNTPQKKGK